MPNVVKAGIIIVEVSHDGQRKNYPANCYSNVYARSALEKCSQQDIENTKKFLRWMSDDVLKGIWERHEKALKALKALEERTLLLTR